MASPSPLRSTYAAAPMVIGGASASRAFSLWPWAKPSTPTENVAAASAPVEATPVVETPEAIAAAPQDISSVPLAEPPVVPTEVDFSSIESIVKGQDILDMPEQIGYLHAIGLDYGWGPTSMMQWILEHVHVWSGLGWGGSIFATAILLRAAMFYPQVKTQIFNAKMQEMRKDPRSKEAISAIQKSLTDNDPELRQKGQYLQKMLHREYGVSNWEMLWGFMQIPFSFGLFRIISGMTAVPVPSLESAGFLWFTDLTVSDPYFLLPALATGLMVSSMIINTKYQPAKQKSMAMKMGMGVGVLGFVCTTFLSAGVNLMAMGLGASTLATSVILNTKAVREALGLSVEVAAAPTKPTYEAPRTPGIEGVRQRLTDNLGEMKKGFQESVSNYTGGQGSEQDRAERKRKEMIQKLEDMRKQQEREEFEKKYKSRR